MVVEPARQLALVQQHRPAGTNEHVGVLALVVVGGQGIGEQKGGHAGSGKLGQGGAARPANRQIALRQHGGQIGHEGADDRLEAELVIQLAGGQQVGFARLMENLPAGQAVAGLIDGAGDVFVECPGAAAAAEDKEPSRPLFCGTRILAGPGADAADRIAGHAQWAAVAEFGLRLREAGAQQRGLGGQPAGGSARQHVLLQQDQRNAAAHGGPAHGHAGVAAQSNHGADLFLFEETFGGQVADEVFQHEGDSLAGAARKRPARQRAIIEPGGRHLPPLKFLAAAGEGDPQPRQCGRELLGHGQSGKQVSGGAAAGEDQVKRSFHGMRTSLAARLVELGGGFVLDVDFQPGRAQQGAQRRRDPEAHDDLVFRPAAKLEMMMQRAHRERAVAAATCKRPLAG